MAKHHAPKANITRPKGKIITRRRRTSLAQRANITRPKGEHLCPKGNISYRQVHIKLLP